MHTIDPCKALIWPVAAATMSFAGTMLEICTQHHQVALGLTKLCQEIQSDGKPVSTWPSEEMHPPPRQIK